MENDWTDELPWLGQYTLDEVGNPVPATSLLEWGRWLETTERHVALTKFAWGEVSTVFLGLDHSFYSDAVADPLHHHPVLWETMVFGGKLDGEMDRYESREEAIEGHHTMVERCKTAEEDPDNRIGMEMVKSGEQGSKGARERGIREQGTGNREQGDQC